MFDRNFDVSLVVSHPGEICPAVEEADQTRPLTGAILALSEADDVSFHHLGHASHGSALFTAGLSAFPSLENKYALLQAELEARFQSGALSDHPFWLPKYDHVLCLPLVRDGGAASCIALTYPAQLPEPRRQALLDRVVMIAPLLCSHMELTNKLAASSRRYDGAMSFLNNTQVGIMMFDNQGHMTLANNAARKSLENHDGIRLGKRGPVAVALKDASRFQLALEHQIAENAGGWPEQHKSTVFLIHRKNGVRPFVATMSPVPTAAKHTGDPAVMLHLFDPSADHLDHLDAVCELYGLSRAEARLVHSLAAGKTIEEAASAMRIKAPTARTYLKHIFSKTNTRRQIDLVRLLRLSTGRLISRTMPEALV